MKDWSQKEIILLASNKTDREVAKLTGRSEPAIRGKRQRLAQAAEICAVAPVSEAKVPTFEDDKAKHDNAHWRREYQALEKKYNRALKASSATDQLVEMAASLAPTSYSPLPKVTPAVRSHGGKDQSAVLLLTDTHVGLVVDPKQTLGFGGYNFDTFLRRLKFLEGGVLSILRDHVSTEIRELVTCLGGDMIDGALNHGAEAGQKVTLFQQFYGAGHAIAQFFRNIAPHVPVLRVYGTVGNHPRWGTQHKMPTSQRFSNLDMFLYAYIQALTADIPNIEWNLDTQPVALFDVQGFLFQLLHGDILRGGDKALGVPNHAVGRIVSAGAQLFGKYGQRSPDFYLTGHLHREIVLPTAKGAFIVGGGFPGIDGYGLASGFTPVDPSQTFFLVHPTYGKTATYNIALKFAKMDGPTPYDIPGDWGL